MSGPSIGRMDAAATIIAGTALVVAVFSAYFSRQSAGAAARSAEDAKRLADVEVARHLAERTPIFEATIEPMNHGSWHRLVVELQRPHVLDRLSVRIGGGGSLRFTPDQEGVAEGGAEAVRGRLEAFTPNAAWQVSFDASDRGTTALVTATAGLAGDEWTVPLQVRLPPPPPRMVSF